MSSLSADPQHLSSLAPGEVREIWVRHLTSFCIPLTALAYVWTGPHLWYVAPLFLIPMGVFYWLDTRGWAKDKDLYTRHGRTVGPLPNTGKDPIVRDRLHARYNTRYLSGR